MIRYEASFCQLLAIPTRMKSWENLDSPLRRFSRWEWASLRWEEVVLINCPGSLLVTTVDHILNIVSDSDINSNEFFSGDRT